MKEDYRMIVKFSYEAEAFESKMEISRESNEQLS